MDRQQKAELKDILAQRFLKSKGAVIAEYRGMTVEAMTQLRRKLKDQKADFKVLKNRIARKALMESVPAMASLSEHLKGPIGIAYFYGDPAQGTKAMLEFEKDSELFKVKVGMLENRLLASSELKRIADLPSKDVLLAKAIGSILSPHRGLVNTLIGVPRNLVQVINAIKEKKA